MPLIFSSLFPPAIISSTKKKKRHTEFSHNSLSGTGEILAPILEAIPNQQELLTKSRNPWKEGACGVRPRQTRRFHINIKKRHIKKFERKFSILLERQDRQMESSHMTDPAIFFLHLNTTPFQWQKK